MGPSLTSKQQRFVEEYLVDLNATKSAIRAGYSEKTARSQGNRMLTNVDISQAIQNSQKLLSAKTEITQEWIVERLKENVERSMQIEEVKDKDGNPSGEFIYQGSVANRALELLGKHVGMFTEQTRVIPKESIQLTIIPSQP